MDNERCRNLKEFKAYIEGFQAAKGGRPPNAVEWANIVEELRSIQLEPVDAVMSIAGQLSIPSIPYTPPIKFSKNDLGMDVKSIPDPAITPRTYGNHR